MHRVSPLRLVAMLPVVLADLGTFLFALATLAVPLQFAVLFGVALSVVLHEVVRRNRVRWGIVYLQITRGVSRRDHAFPPAGTAPMAATSQSWIAPAPFRATSPSSGCSWKSRRQVTTFDITCVIRRSSSSLSGRCWGLVLISVKYAAGESTQESSKEIGASDDVS